MSNEVVCPGCSVANPAGAKFCMSCGGALAAMIACPACSTELPDGAKFCFNCGHQLSEGATAGDDGATAQEVARSIADQLLEITEGKGERRNVTMLFCDIVNSTATAEQLDPEQWSGIVADALERMIEPVERLGGSVARILGDAILAYFGAPVAHEDDPQRAVLAAIEMRDACAQLRDRVNAKYGVSIDFRIGINTGLVVVGQVGSDQFGEYAALGDAANVAARMEQSATPGTIRISDATRRPLGDQFELIDDGTVEVKGRQEPLQVWQVVSAIGTPGQVRGVAGMSSPLVGRDAELRALVDAVASVQGGNGRIVSVMAEAGLGKSRLVRELRDRVDPAEVRWIRGQCHAWNRARPYHPFLEALRDAFGITPGDTPAQGAGKVRAHVADLLGPDHVQPTAALLATMLHLPLSAEEHHRVAYLDPPVLRERMLDAVVEVVEAEAADRPTVLVLDDLHWADEASLDLLDRLLALTERARLALLLLHRPSRTEPSWRIHEAAARDHAHRHVVVELRPLDAEQSQSLVSALLRLDGLPAALRALILARAEGNPLFVEELLRTLLDHGAIAATGNGFVVEGDVTELAIPDSLTALVAARVDALGPDARRVLQLASVMGREFDHDLLAEAVGAQVDLASVVAELQRRELLVDRFDGGGRRLRFRHAITHEATYDTLLQTVRAEMHLVVGERLEEKDPTRSHDLARHFLRAGQPGRALPYLVASGEESFSLFAPTEAIAAFRSALAVWTDQDDPRLAQRSREGLGAALMFIGEAQEAYDSHLALIELGERLELPELVISGQNKAGFVALMGLGDPARGSEHLEAAKGLADEAEHQAGLAEFHVGYCLLNMHTGKLAKAAEHLGDAAEVCFTLDPFHRNFGLTHFASTQVWMLKWPSATQAVRRAKEQAIADDDRQHLSTNLGYESLLAMVRGDMPTALQLAHEAHDMAEEIGAVWETLYTSWIGGQVAVVAGHFEQAVRWYEQGERIAAQIQSVGMQAACLAGLASLDSWLHGHATPRAIQLEAQALPLVAHPMAAAFSSSCLSDLAYLHLRDGDIEPARECLATEAARPSATTLWAHPEVLICSSGVAMADGDLDRARALVREVNDFIDAHDFAMWRARGRLVTAVMDSLDGDVEAMARGLDEAWDLAIQHGARATALLVSSRAVPMLAAAGRDAEAGVVRERHLDLVEDIGETFEDAQLRRAFRRQNMLTA